MATAKKAGTARAAAKDKGREDTKAAKAAKAARPKTAARPKAGKDPVSKAVSKPVADAADDDSLLVGRPAPDFRLPDETGREVSLADYRGKKLVLYFYPKDSTPGCTQESCDFRDNLSRLGSKGAAVLGLSADSVESHRRFKEKQGLNFPLLSDPGHQALEAYGVWQEKSLYGRKFMGIVRTTVLIDEKGTVAKVWPKVKVTGHVDEVLASL